MSKPVKLIVSHSTSMLEVHIDGELHNVGNFWDFNIDSWVNILTAAGVDVTEEEIEEDEDDDE